MSFDIYVLFFRDLEVVGEAGVVVGVVRGVVPGAVLGVAEDERHSWKKRRKNQKR